MVAGSNQVYGNQYYDPTTRLAVDPRTVSQYVSGYDEWNNPIVGYRDSTGRDVSQGMGWTDWLVGQGFRPDLRSGTGALEKYMNDLSRAGLTADDFTKALQAQGLQYAAGPMDEWNNGGYFARDPNAAWWNEMAVLRTLGNGLQATKAGTPGVDAWKSLWNQGTETFQQNDVANAWEQGRGKGSDWDDLGDIFKGLSFVAGVGGLAGTGFLDSLGLSTGSSIADNAIVSAIKSGLTGGNPLTGGLTSAITGGVTDAIPDVNPVVDRLVNGAVGGTVGAAVNGGNIGTGLVNGLTSGAINAAGGAINNIVGSFNPTGNVNDNPIEQGNTITSNNPITDNNPMIPNTGGVNNMGDGFGNDPVLTDPSVADTWLPPTPDQSGGTMTNDQINNAISQGFSDSGYSDPNNPFNITPPTSNNGQISNPVLDPNATGGGFWSSLLRGLTTQNGSGNTGLGSIINTLGAYMSGSKTSSSYSDLMRQLLEAGNVSNRPGAQWALGRAQNYINDGGMAKYVNEMANPIMASYAQHLPGTVAKSGDLTGAMNRSMTDMGAAISGNYNGFINSLLGATGTTQPNAGIAAAGTAGGVGINTQNTANSGIYGTLGNIAGNAASTIFNTPTASGTTYTGS